MLSIWREETDEGTKGRRTLFFNFCPFLYINLPEYLLSEEIKWNLSHWSVKKGVHDIKNTNTVEKYWKMEREIP